MTSYHRLASTLHWTPQQNFLHCASVYLWVIVMYNFKTMGRCPSIQYFSIDFLTMTMDPLASARWSRAAPSSFSHTNREAIRAVCKLRKGPSDKRLPEETH